MVQAPDTIADRRADERWMQEALDLAAAIARPPWPNPPVGAVVVRGGEAVGRGAHAGPGEPHAEIVALQEAGARARGATLYCTLEPCNHRGRTPPCAPAVAASKVRRVVLGVRDPNLRVRGGGLAVLRAAGIEVTLGVLAERALDLLWPFVVTEAFCRPYVLLKTAASLDGRFAPPERSRPARAEPVYLTGLEARSDVHRLRRWVDLVLVGENTLRRDRPRLDGRLAPDGCPRCDPAVGYVDTDLSYREGWQRTGHLVFCGQSASPAAMAALRQDRARVVVCGERGGHVDPASLLQEAFGASLHAVMVEGGPTLAASFLAAGVVDRWVHYMALRVLGGGPGWPRDPELPSPVGMATPGLDLTAVDVLGGDVRIVMDRQPFHRRLAALMRETQIAGSVEA